MRWDQYQNGEIVLTQSKTAQPLTLAIARPLAEALDGAPRQGMTMVISAKGRPYREDNFRHRFAKAMRQAGLKGLTFHGLRNTMTAMLAEAGCTNPEIKAVTGHVTDQMVQHYLGHARQKERSASAIGKLEKLLDAGRNS
ncbi:tyrosine-type recombinase/integrase [Paramagnetospirillum marisnigri]